MAKTMLSVEIKNHPLSLDEFVAFLDLPMLVRLSDMFKNEPSEYIVNSQIQQLTNRCLENYIGEAEESKCEEETA